MKIGFKSVDDKDQTTNKRLIKISRSFFSAKVILLWLFLFASILGCIYFGIRSLTIAEDLVKFKSCLLVLAVIAGARLLIVPLNKFFEKISLNAQTFSPEEARKSLPAPSSITLPSTLYYMQGSPARLAWDIIFGIINTMLLCTVFFNGNAKLFVLLRSLVIMILIMVCGHLLLTAYYKNRSYCKKLMKITKKYLTIENDAYFTQRLEKSLKEHLLYRSRQFILTGDFILGYTENNSFFQPAAIPLDEIAEAEFYIVQSDTRTIINKGVLACKLNNGKIVDFYTGQNHMNEIVKKVLDYYKFDYKKNKSMLYKAM